MRRTVLLVTIVLALVSVACGNGGSGVTDTPVSLADNGIDTGPPECVTAQDCDDGDPCSDDSCQGGKCVNEPVDCDDGNLCTNDLCVQGECKNDYKPLCCLTDKDCDDGNPCTTDTCYSHACQYETPDPACCSSAEQCDDGNACTLDNCLDNKCTHQPTTGPDCCEKDLDCHDSNPCTDDTCEDGKCVWVNNGCCQYDEDCVDDDPCTENGTCNEKLKCEFDEIPGCCADDEECDDGNACTSEVCFNLHCEYSPVADCCTSDEDCVVDDPCKHGECVLPEGGQKGECVITLVTSPECCTTSVLAADFDDMSPGGFSLESLYGDGPGWVVDDHRSVSPPASLYFGDPATLSYDVDVQTPVGGKAVSPDIDLSKTIEPELRFSVWKETEIVASSDVLSIVVVHEEKENTVWSTSQFPQFANTGGVFVPVIIGLAQFTGQTVSIVFVFDTLNGFANDFEGVYLDDVKVVGKCQ